MLECPGSIPGTGQVVNLVENPVLETRNETQPALLTRPGLLFDEWISGQYPAYLVANGDRFLAEVGCLASNPGCDVTFRLDYRSNTGVLANLGVWEEFYDGVTTLIDIDLSALAGRSIRLILGVTNNASLSDPGAFWLGPRIQNGYPEADLVLSWNQQDANGAACNQLQIYQTAASSGEAIAIDCENRTRRSSRGVLTSSEIDTLLELVRKLKSFEGEYYTAASGSRAWFSFYGHGRNDGSMADIQAIQNLAQRIYNRLAP